MYRDATPRITKADLQDTPKKKRQDSPFVHEVGPGNPTKITGLLSIPAPDSVYFVAPINPMGKPRMTRRDKWAGRPAVDRYFAWCDKLRAFAPKLPAKPRILVVVAYLAIPESWSKKKAAAVRGRLHDGTPDADNIAKAIMDALMKQDKSIARLSIEKRWDDGNGPRMEIEIG